MAYPVIIDMPLPSNFLSLLMYFCHSGVGCKKWFCTRQRTDGRMHWKHRVAHSLSCHKSGI